jgi:hypothetical protein
MFFSFSRDSKSFLTKLPSSGWFIAGGHVLTPDRGDIDIFFETEADYKHVLEVAKRFFGGTPYDTPNATTFEASDKRIQLVHHSFMPVMDTLARFDINKSRQAISPDGTLVQHPSFHEPLYFDVDMFRPNTFPRYFKYIYDKQQAFPLDQFQSDLHTLLTRPLDTKYTLMYGNQPHKVTIIQAISRLIRSHFIAFGWILPAIEALPAETRLKVYMDIMLNGTDIFPLDSMSPELQTAAYLHQPIIYCYDSDYNSDYDYPRPELTDTIRYSYPELFL